MPRGYYTRFTPEQEAQMIAEYLTKPIKRLGEEMNCNGARVERFLNKNGYFIPPELAKQRQLDSRRKKGDVPFNKGLKQTAYLTPEAIERTKVGRFKKGHTPKNTTYKGAITTRKDKTGRPYQSIKLDDNHWELVHRVLWEKERGKIPEGHVVIFKDGNASNIVIENLEVISKAENMTRNTIHNYPKHVKENIRLIAKIKKKIKQNENRNK